MKNCSTLAFTALLLIIAGTCLAQGGETKESKSDTVIVIEDDPILAHFDSLLVATYLNHFCFSVDTCILNVEEYSMDSIPSFSEEVLRERLEVLNAVTPMDLVYNSDVDRFISLYAKKRKKMTSRVLGTAELYFPMFNQVFDKYDIPYEMKYLAIVESALNPQAKSRAGAVGLWQFMYATGKMYGLDINSYVDERMDPWKSTDAACRYLSKLHARYDDWNLALAAYNSGPGNVNKAIRRSGGKKDYWEIRKYLPRETRGYVPAFIAVNYIMNYASEHNIYPHTPDFSFFACDTLNITEQLKFDQITTYTGVSTEELQALNPSYKRNVIPANGKRNNLCLPIDKIGVFLSNEDSIYNYMKEEAQEYNASQDLIIYRVRSGDVLGKIAQMHNVSVSNLREWNNLRGNMIHPGQKLNIYSSKPASKKTSQKSETKKQIDSSSLPKTKDGKYQYHTVQKGDTLWDIAKLYKGVDMEQLKQLNADVNVKDLKQGQQIKIKKLN